MKFIFLIAAFNAVFFTVLLLQKRPKALHDKILIFWLLFLGLYIGYFGLKQKIIYGAEDVTLLVDRTKVQTKYSGSRLSDPEAKRIAEQLKKNIESSKSYLNPDS